MSIKSRKFTKGIRLKGTTDAATLDGEIRNDSAASKLKVNLGATERSVVTEDQSQTLTNKTHTSPVIDTGVSGTAIDTDVTLAADSDTKLASQKAVKAYVDTSVAGKDDASEITYTPSTLADWDSSTDPGNVDGASDQLASRVKVNEGSLTTTTGKTDDLVTLSGVAANSTNLGTFTGTTITDNVTEKVAIQELETSVETKIETASVDTLTNKTIDADNNTITNLAHGAEVDDPATGVHGVTGNIVGHTDTQTITNKTITAVGNTISGLVHGTEVDDPSSGVHGVVGSVVGTTDAQVITNKDIDGGTASNTSRVTLPSADKTVLDALTRKEGTIVYDSTGNKGYLDDGANLIEIGAGAGGSGINYLSGDDTDFENSIGGWLTSGGGSTPSTLTRTITNNIRGVGSLQIDVALNSINSVIISKTFKVDKADLAKKMIISFDYDFSDSGYNDDDFIIQMQKGSTTPTIIFPVNGEGIKAGKGTFYAQFQTDATDEFYNIIIRNKAVTNPTMTLYIDNVKVGPQVITHGTIVTDWEATTVTYDNVNLGTGSFIETFSKRIGDTLHIRGALTIGTGGDVTGSLLLNMPSAYAIDHSKLQSIANASAGYPLVGTAYAYDSSLGESHQGSALVLGQTEQIRFGPDGSGTSIYNNTSPFDWTATDQFEFEFSVPIQGWSSNAKMSEDFSGREVVARVSASTTSCVSGVDTPLIFPLINYDTTGMYNPANGVFTIPETGYYRLASHVEFNSTAWAAGNTVRLGLDINGTSTLFLQDHVIKAALTTNADLQGSTTLHFTKDDTVEFTAFQNNGPTIAVGGSSFRTYASIEKLASPQTILENETVAARYTSNSGQAVVSSTVVKYEDLTPSDTHNAYNTSTGIYTIPITGWYSVSASIYTTIVAWSTGQYLDLNILLGVDVKKRRIERVQIGFTQAIGANVDGLVYATKGDEISIQSTASRGSTPLIAGSTYNVFSIARIK